MIKNIGDFKDYNDGTIKSVYDMGDKRIIEMSVLYNKEDKDVVCVPTHHFCNLGCKMCHLTNKGLNKAMIPIDIDNFMYCLTETLKKYKTGKKLLLISFMGVGEPLLNIGLMKSVFDRENELKKIGYTDISFALSTMMPNNNILILKKIVNKYNIPLKVHFSLHTPIDTDRKELIPSTRVNVEDALKMLYDYRNTIINNEIIMENYNKFHRTSDPIEIHYTLIENVNDGEKELNKLIGLLRKYKIAIKFIRFNPINSLSRSLKEEEWIKKIKQNIIDLRIKTYSPPGREIGSSCGEFTKHYYHYEIETKEEYNNFKEWEKIHKINL